MALSCVQAGTKVENGAGNSATVNGAITPTAGNTIIIGVGAYGVAGFATSAFTASDSVFGSYTQRTNHAQANNQGVSFFEAINVTGVARNVTVSSGTNGSAVVGLIHEISTTLSTISFDAGTGTDTGSSPPTGNTANPVTAAQALAQNSEILFALMVNTDGANPATLTVNGTGSTGGTWALKSTTNSQETNGSAIMTQSMPFLVVSSNATSPAHGWNDGNSAACCMAIAAWKDSAAAVATGLVPQRTVRGAGV